LSVEMPLESLPEAAVLEPTTVVSLLKSDRSRSRLTALDITLCERLGSGSYGAVYRATTVHHGAVAVKVLPLGPKDISSELKHELKLLQRCSSPYMVRALGAFSKPHELWIVMELCPHGSLLDVLRTIEQPFAEEQIALACRDALRALQYMHTQGKGIIHRDVKCANLLLGDGIVKLADLGIALQLNSTASKRMSMIGTPHWMAPEVVGYGKYDARADVWSLGIAAIEMAQGEPPHYDLRPILRVMFAIAKEQPPTLRNPSAASASFNDFLMKMLTKEMTSRPSSTEMLQHPFVAGEGGEGLDPNASGLHALVHAVQEAVAYKLANPTPEHASHDSLNWGGSTCTVGRSLVNGSSDYAEGGATFIRHGTSCAGGALPGTVLYHGSLSSDASAAAGGTFVQRGTPERGHAVPPTLPWMRPALGVPSPSKLPLAPTMPALATPAQAMPALGTMRCAPPPPPPTAPSSGASEGVAIDDENLSPCFENLSPSLPESTLRKASAARTPLSKQCPPTTGTGENLSPQCAPPQTPALSEEPSPALSQSGREPSPALSAVGSPAFGGRHLPRVGDAAPPARSAPPPPSHGSVDDGVVSTMRRTWFEDGDLMAPPKTQIQRSASDDALFEKSRPKPVPRGFFSARTPRGNWTPRAAAPDAAVHLVRVDGRGKDCVVS